MKNIFKALKLPIASLLVLTSFIACDKEFSVIESSVLGEGNAHFFTDSLSYPISAYNKKLEALQINNLASNLLGFFNDPEYGKTTASIVTQLTPSSYSPDFGVNPTIEEVILNIPYFNTATGTDTDGNTTYQLDSVYGNQGAPIKLTIYRSNYFLRDFDPSEDANSSQYYYSNASSTSNSALNGNTTINFDDHLKDIIFTTNAFIPSNDATVVITDEGTDDEVTTRSEPAFREILDTAYWQETIISKEDDAVLSNANNFKNYFRGLYFKAEATDDGAMVLLDLASSNASITINYTKGETDSRTDATYTLNFSGNKLNTFINEFTPPLVDGDDVNGDKKLYLKGLEGSMAVIDLFGSEDLDGNLVPDQLDEFLKEYRKTDDEGAFILDDDGNFVLKRLINEAHLAIYEDESEVDNTEDDNGDVYHKYDRIYAYDIKNNSTTVDYTYDASTNTNDALSSKFFSLGQRDASGKYKIRLTEHLNNIIQSDSTNYNIGLVLSNNVNYTNNAEILNSIDEVTAVPAASIISPRGTILHGSHASVSQDKRLTLKIFYTETKED